MQKKHEFADVVDGTVMKLTIEDSGYVITLFNNIKEKFRCLLHLDVETGKTQQK